MFVFQTIRLLFQDVMDVPNQVRSTSAQLVRLYGDVGVLPRCLISPIIIFKIWTGSCIPLNAMLSLALTRTDNYVTPSIRLMVKLYLGRKLQSKKSSLIRHRYDYLMELDRVLHPGGYWVLTGPPISWKSSYKGWEKEAKDLKNEQVILEDLTKRLCWKIIVERGPIAVWRMPTNHLLCIKKSETPKLPRFCTTLDPDVVWYNKMNPCITPLPKVKMSMICLEVLLKTGQKG